MRSEILVTGMGVLSPVGIGKHEFWEALHAGTQGFGDITVFDASSLPVRVAGQVDFDPVELLGKKGLRTMDRSTRLLCSAARLALEDAGIEVGEDTTHGMGVVTGTTFGSLHSIAQFDRDGLVEGPRYVNPSLFSNTVINSPASQVSIRYKIKGFNTTISTGGCSSLDAVSYAADFLGLRRADTVLAGGVEELCEETFDYFQALGCLSGGDGTTQLCCPFDRRRNGIIFSEAAAVVILEEAGHARGRGARVLARVLGSGTCFEPCRGAEPRYVGEGLRKAIAGALEVAALRPEDVDCIFACANSTRETDRMETTVIKEVFGEYAYRVPVTAIKSAVGETYSASGALSLAAAVGALEEGRIPPTVNYQEKDPECDLGYVVNARPEAIATALVLASDPYGYNSAVLVGRDG